MLEAHFIQATIRTRIRETVVTCLMTERQAKRGSSIVQSSADEWSTTNSRSIPLTPIRANLKVWRVWHCCPHIYT